MILSSIPQASASFLVHMADAAARSFVLGCIAAAALNVSRVKSVSVRLNVWRTVLCVALIMPFLGVFLPALTFRLPAQVTQKFERVRFASGAGNVVAHQEGKGPAQFVEFAQDSRDRYVFHSYSNSGPVNGKAAASAITVASDADAPASTNKNRGFSLARVIGWGKSQLSEMPWTAVAAASYLLVTLGFLIRFLIGLILSVRLERLAQRVNDPRALALLSSRARSLGIKRVPRLSESELLSVPVTFGVLRPAILLPSGWRDWDDAELDAVISHEVSHVARRDAFIDRLSLLHRAVFWFSPLSWYLTGCLAELAEEASDEAALAAGADRTRYAETLLGFFVELEAAPGRAWWQGVAMAKAGQAEKRLDRILEWKGSVAMQLKKSVVVVVVMCAVPVVYVAAALRPGVYNFSSSEYGAMQAQEPAPPAPAPAPRPVASPAPVVTVDPATRVVVTTTVAPKVSVTIPRLDDVPTPVPQVAPVARVMVKTAVTPKASVAIAPVAMVDPVKVRALAPLQIVTQSSRLSSSDEAELARRLAQSYQSGSTVVVMSGERDGEGHQFVISSGNTYISVSGNSESYGTDHPSEFVEFLQEKNPGDFIWFRRDGKSYVIRDAATIKRAKDFFAQVQELDKKQEELGKQQEALGEKQEALGKQQEEIHVQIPDMTEDLRKLEAELKALGSSGTQEDLGRIQSAIGELQSKLGELQSVAGEEQGKLGEKQGALGEEQGRLGELQGELGRQQEQIFREASRQMKTLIDDAMAHGLAKAE
ncbi:MAG TPA: M56 family metallopeptidase [Candidatus Acidoferrales bacterium]|jgi:beta-lactamase regulating signal transducer with metallopeptidase domain|nr:M56 family metallopeptidase [Candidatus Acidoferrales bacterium]